ncbi:hypothetical protein LTR56_008881 [Elasticomyces elasticus]|nr:hypothetical protein LTR22_015872 [Elasticomyces elasticus]KAK3646003.1 hypothetical protein LTR56_008881 [Elasticomyces elasticus]KAK4914870.1 hypothetical protein LTR49_016982 [Elasticomyces elasticus]
MRFFSVTRSASRFAESHPSSTRQAQTEEKPQPERTECSQHSQHGFEYVDLQFDLPQLTQHTGIKLHCSPLSWSMKRKILVLATPFMAALLAAYSAGAYGMAAPALQLQWHISSVVVNVGITLFVLGFAFAPIILALISELYGRYWVFLGAGVVSLLGTLGCAFTDSLAGCGASVFATLTGGVVGDLFRKEDRNTPMALYSLAIIMGTGVGPLVSGAVAGHMKWRWVFYLQAILIGLTTIGLGLTFQETRANVLLERNCRALNDHLARSEHHDPQTQPTAIKSTQCQYKGQGSCRVRFRVPALEHSSLAAIIWRSFKFPLRLLFTESIVFWFSAWVSFAWAILYMQFASISLVYRSVYSFDSTQVGGVYTAVVVGSILGAAMSIAQDYVCRRYWPAASTRPQSRLYLACVATLLLPAGLFMFGFTSRASIHWIVPTTAIGMFIAGIFVIYLAVFNYLVDAYGAYASSALAAQSMCRNLLAGVFPLFTKAMFERLGYQGAGCLLGGVGLLLCLVPWMLCLYGDAIRRRSVLVQKMDVG